MASIKPFLDKIRTAVYGKEVRGSLADGLDAVNKETEDATELTADTKRRQDSVEQQFDDVQQNATDISPSDVEIVAARTNTETGDNHSTVGRRMDAEYKQVTSQLADTVDSVLKIKEETLKQLNLSLGYVPYGKITTPVDFVHLPFKLIRKNDGVIYHDFNFEELKDGAEIFISNSGDNSSGDGSRNNPYRDMYYAIEQIRESSGSNFVIKCLDVHIRRGIRNRVVDNKTVAIVPDNSQNKVYITSHWDDLEWQSEGNGVWKTPYIGIYSIFDFRVTDQFGVPVPFNSKETLAECKTEKGSWYFANHGSDIYVHTFDGKSPNDTNYAINVHEPYFEPMLLNDAVLFAEDCVFLHGGNADTMRIQSSVTGGVSGSFITNNCIIAGGDLRVNRSREVDALSIVNVKNTLLFNTIVAHGGEDGLNYHYTSVTESQRRDCLVVEFNVASYGHGKYSNTNTSNSSTAHEGISVLRVNGLYEDSMGPVVNDAGGCYFIGIDSHSGKSKASIQRQRSAFRGDNDNAQNKGKMLLINCSGGGDDTYSIYTGDDMDVSLQAFRGMNFQEGLEFEVVV